MRLGLLIACFGAVLGATGVFIGLARPAALADRLQLGPRGLRWVQGLLLIALFAWSLLCGATISALGA